MADIPTPPNPVKSVKGIGARIKGLPKWTYIAAIGVGGGVIYYMHTRSAAANAADTTGTDPNASLSADANGQVYPDSGMPSGSGFDYGAYGQTVQDATDANSKAIQDLTDLLGQLKEVGIIGGGNPSPGGVAAPAPTVVIQNPVGGSKPKTSSPHPGSDTKKCPKAFPRHNAKNGAPGPNSCYKCEKNTKANKHRYPVVHRYQNGHGTDVTKC